MRQQRNKAKIKTTTLKRIKLIHVIVSLFLCTILLYSNTSADMEKQLEELKKLYEKGLISKEIYLERQREILSGGGAPEATKPTAPTPSEPASSYPAWLAGIWDMQGMITEGCQAFGAGCGPIYDLWEFVVTGDNLALYDIEAEDTKIEPRWRHAKGKKIPLYEVHFTGRTLRFVVDDTTLRSRTHYDLKVKSENRLEGTIRIVSESSYGLPSMRLGGTVSLVKQ